MQVEAILGGNFMHDLHVIGVAPYSTNLKKEKAVLKQIYAKAEQIINQKDK